MKFENPSEFFLSWLLFPFVYILLSYFLQDFPINFDLNEGFRYTKNSSVIVSGSQTSYLTKVTEKLKATNDYTDEFILLCCYILRTRTQSDIQNLMKQILCTIQTRDITTKSIVLDDECDLYCDIKLDYSFSPIRGKKDAMTTLIEFNIFSRNVSKEEILHFMRLMREHYTGIIGNARSDFISEMYTHLYNEPCLADEGQLNRINKTPKEVLDCYHRHPENPEGFIRGLLRNK